MDNRYLGASFSVVSKISTYMVLLHPSDNLSKWVWAWNPHFTKKERNSGRSSAMAKVTQLTHTRVEFLIPFLPSAHHLPYLGAEPKGEKRGSSDHGKSFDI